MADVTPKIDPRTAADLEAKVMQLLAKKLPQFRLDPAQPDVPKQLQGNYRALVKIFARFSEIILQRLNQVPDKTFLAFLDLLGAARLPPQPARVPLTFTLTAGSTVDGVVPAGTQVAAPPIPGDPDPVLFETERELVVTAAQLDAVFVRDPQRDTWGDRTTLIQNSSSSQAAFRGDRPVEHSIYIGHTSLWDFPGTATLTITLNLTKPLGDGGLVEVQIWQANLQTWNRMATPAFSTSGNLTITLNAQVSLPLQTIHGITSRWIRCRLMTPITLEATPQQGMVRVSQLPAFQGLTLRANFQRRGLNPDQVFSNTSPVDPSRLLFPFGEKPKLGDTFYLAQAEAFAKANATITLNVTVTQALADTLNVSLNWEIWNGKWTLLGTSTPKAASTGQSTPGFADQTLAFTSSVAGNQLRQVSFTIPNNPPPKPTTINGIESYWIRVRIVSGNYGQDATYQAVAVPTGTPGRDANGNIYALRPATFTPPMIDAITVDYTWTRSEIPEILILNNDARYSENLVQLNNGQPQLPATPIQPFRSSFSSLETAKPSLYFGFTLPPNRTQFPNQPLSLYSHLADLTYGARLVPLDPLQSQMVGNAGAVVIHRFEFVNSSDRRHQFRCTCLRTTWTTTPAPAEFSLEPQARQLLTVEVQVPATGSSDRDSGILRLTIEEDPAVVYTAQFQTQRGGTLPEPERLEHHWAYWNGTIWEPLSVQDDSENLTGSGLVQFLPPADFAPSADFGLSSRYWLRLQWQSGDYVREPQLQRLLFNTTLASQTVTLQNEVLGSSDGSSNQRFQVVQTPILAGPKLYVREPELPSQPEQERLEAEEGPDALDIRRDDSDRPQEIWVRWHEVSDFYGSTARDRHYVLDHLTGELQFGSGINGLIPPTGTGNVRLARYQTGGGIRGNRAAGDIVQLKTTVPYIEKVINLEPASGGADAESLERLRERMPKTIRHRGRAVTVEDYEDLAMLASPGVARAKCVPLSNLQQDPFDADPEQAGAVSVIIVPRSSEVKPLPSFELIDLVQTYLNRYRSPTASVYVVGPLYMQVRLTMTLALKQLEGASGIEQLVLQRLRQFLHPLTGGFEGNGWAFGRAPHKSDFYRLLESIPGIDHVQNLNVLEVPDTPQVPATKRFLVYSGQHTIRLIFEPE